jgi:hypothetical protein
MTHCQFYLFSHPTSQFRIEIQFTAYPGSQNNTIKFQRGVGMSSNPGRHQTNANSSESRDCLILLPTCSLIHSPLAPWNGLHYAIDRQIKEDANLQEGI